MKYPLKTPLVNINAKHNNSNGLYDYMKKEIERLNNIINKAINKAKTMKASMLLDTIDGIEIDSKFVHDLYDLIKYMENELKGVELTENDKKQVKWLKEEFKAGVDKE